MGKRTRSFNAAAYYATRRVRSEWIADSPAVLVKRIALLPRRRFVLQFGTWRAKPTRTATP